MKRLVPILIALVALVAASSASGHSARDAYLQIWKQDRPFLGAEGMPAPLVVFDVKGGDYTFHGRTGIRTIFLSTYTTKELFSHRWRWRNEGRFTIEHEVERVLGPDKPLANTGDGRANAQAAGAGLANSLPNRLLHRRNTGQGNVKRWARNHLPCWGQNPQTIPWPSA